MMTSAFRHIALLALVLSVGACVTTKSAPSLPAPVQAHMTGAQAGDAESQYRLGMDYTNGFGVAQSYGTAVEWFRKAADKGHAGGAFMLGAAYGSGRGIAEDPALALSWYDKAAAADHPRAQFLAAEAYANGRGTKQDLPRAAKLYRKAAEQGHPDAMYALGALTATGRGVKKDDVAAARWLFAADALGKDSADLLAVLKKRLPANAFAKAKRDARVLAAAKPSA